MDATIRPAERGDADALRQLYRHLIPDEEPAPLPVAQSRIDALGSFPGSVILVADTTAGLAASVTLIVVPNMTRNGAPYAFIENVVTHSDHRRQGLARTLLHEAERRAWAAGCYRIMIVSGNHNAAGHATYAAAGYAATKTGFQKRRIADRSHQA